MALFNSYTHKGFGNINGMLSRREIFSILPCKSSLQGINLCLQEGTLVFHNNLLSVEKTDSHRKGIFHNQFPKSRNFWTSGRGGAAGSRGS